MNNKQIYLFNQYNRLSYTHLYLLGIEKDGFINAVPLDTNNNQLKALFYACTRLSEPSDINSKQGTQLRFTPCKDLKGLLASLNNCFPVCTVEHFNRLRQLENIKNRGDAFELAICEYYNISWKGRTKESFDMAPDLYINGKPYQLKYYDAQITTELTIKNAIARAL